MFTSRNPATPSPAEAVCVEGADETFALYLDWREQSSVCESAYRHWAASAHSPDAAPAFAAYAAALDREQQAAAQYENALRLG